MKTYRDEAIVLRTHPLGEADRIITLLTRDHGMSRAVAKGVRRTSSRFGARLEPFCAVQIMVHRGRTLDTLTQVQTIRPYGLQLAQDYELYTRAHVMAESTEKIITEEDEGSSGSAYLLLLGAMHALAHRRHEGSLVMNSYLLRLMALNGWAPSLNQCAICGNAGGWGAFHVPSGGVVCDRCRPTGSFTPGPAVIQLLSELLSGSWPQAEQSEDWMRRQASKLVQAWVQWHVERRISAYHFITDPARPVAPTGVEIR